MDYTAFIYHQLVIRDISLNGKTIQQLKCSNLTARQRGDRYNVVVRNMLYIMTLLYQQIAVAEKMMTRYLLT